MNMDKKVQDYILVIEECYMCPNISLYDCVTIWNLRISTSKRFQLLIGKSAKFCRQEYFLFYVACTWNVKTCQVLRLS